MTSKPYSLGTRAVPKFINFFHPAWWQWQLLRWYQWRWWGPSKPWLVMDGDLCDVKDGALIDADGNQVRLYSSHFHHQPPCCHVGPGMFIVLLYLEASSAVEKNLSQYFQQQWYISWTTNLILSNLSLAIANSRIIPIQKAREGPLSNSTNI